MKHWLKGPYDTGKVASILDTNHISNNIVTNWSIKFPLFIKYVNEFCSIKLCDPVRKVIYELRFIYSYERVFEILERVDEDLALNKVTPMWKEELLKFWLALRFTPTSVFVFLQGRSLSFFDSPYFKSGPNILLTTKKNTVTTILTCIKWQKIIGRIRQCFLCLKK